MIKSLTSLRGIFILFIFFHHCMNLYPGGGTMAVAFFFVLGGFSMTLGYKDKFVQPNFNYKQYITRRCIKFYPLHWLCLIAVLPLVIISGANHLIPVFFANVALVQSWIPISKVYFSFNWVSWYLADTLFFATISPFVFKRIARTSSKGKLFIAVLIAIVYTMVAILIPEDKYHAILYISPYVRLADFVFGIYLALLFFKLKEKSINWWNRNLVSQILVFVLITILVVESCLLSEDARLFAPVYWIPVAMVVLIASLSNTNGGVQPVGKQILTPSR